MAKEAKQANLLAQQQLAEHVVARHQQQIAILESFHRECSPSIDWHDVARTELPESPRPVHSRTEAAETALANYHPGFFARLFGSVKKQRALEEAVANARREDADEMRAAEELHATTCRDIREAREVATAILRGDTSKYLEALSETEAFAGMNGGGSTTTVGAPRRDLITIDAVLPTRDVVPDEEESLTKRGKLSSKQISKTRANQLYQDFICGAALRACREAFAALPVEWVLVTTRTELLDAATGHMMPQPVLSVIAPRRTIEQLNWAAVDASEAMTSFLHRMEFKKTGGMMPVTPFTASDVPPPDLLTPG